MFDIDCKLNVKKIIKLEDVSMDLIIIPIYVVPFKDLFILLMPIEID